MKPVEVVRIQVNEIAGTRLRRAIDIILIDSDVDSVVVEKYTAVGEPLDAVVQNLKIVDRTGC